MKKSNHLLQLIIPAISFLSCNSNTTTQEETKNSQDTTKSTTEESIKMPATITEPAACYALMNNKDTVLLHIAISNNVATGNLLYNFFGKDKNRGIIGGKMKGDTLFATYTFISEGKESTREVAFLKKGDEFTEGYGKVNETTGEPDFTDKTAIKFGDYVVLKKTDCNKDEHGCMKLFGIVWSVVKKNCVDLSATATRLNRIEIKDKGKSPAYIIFSDDKSQAELFFTAK